MPPDPPHPGSERAVSRRGFRIFSSKLDARERRIYGAVTFVFVGTFFAVQWPIYTWFSRVKPFVLGVPFSLFYLIALLLICFFSLLALYRWEASRDKLE